MRQRGQYYTILKTVLIIQTPSSIINKKHLGPTTEIKRIPTLFMIKISPCSTQLRIMILMVTMIRIEDFLRPCLCPDWRDLLDSVLHWTRIGKNIYTDPVFWGLLRTSSPSEFKILIAEKILQKIAWMFQPQQEFLR